MVTTDDPHFRTGERRGTRRYYISSDAYFQWREGGAALQTGTGSIMNISAGAAYILARPSPPIGAEIEVRVAVPGVVPGAPSKSQMRGRGTVIRVMPDKGFVAKVTFHVVKTVEAANLGPSTGPS